MTNKTDRTGALKARRREQILALLRTAQNAGACFVKLSELDAYIETSRPVWILKHDIHGLPLGSLLDLARREREFGIAGTYFFMAPDHSLTRPFYTYSEQARVMRAIEAMDHEIGVHLDPFYLMHRYGRSTQAVVSMVLKQFADEDVTVGLSNFHGNSKFKMPDYHGYTTAVDLVDELERQPDYPCLAGVPPDTAALIRANRTSLAGLGLTHWGDTRLWSARHGHIVTNYITDNWLEKDASMQFQVYAHAPGQYPALSSDDWKATVTQEFKASRRPCRVVFPPLKMGPTRLLLGDQACERWFSLLASQPTRIITQILIHPQHY